MSSIEAKQLISKYEVEQAQAQQTRRGVKTTEEDQVREEYTFEQVKKFFELGIYKERDIRS